MGNPSYDWKRRCSRWTWICFLQCGFQPHVAPQNEPDGGERESRVILGIHPKHLVVPRNCHPTLSIHHHRLWFPHLLWQSGAGWGHCVCQVFVTEMRIRTDMPSPAREALQALISQLSFPLPLKRAHSDHALGLPGP